MCLSVIAFEAGTAANAFAVPLFGPNNNNNNNNNNRYRNRYR